MKIDCSNIINFVNEWNRRNRTNAWKKLGTTSSDNSNPTSVDYNPFVESEEMLKGVVEELQRWSDAHPPRTRKEKFIEMCKENGFENIIKYCDRGILGSACESFNECEDCKKYWNELVD